MPAPRERLVAQRHEVRRRTARRLLRRPPPRAARDDEPLRAGDGDVHQAQLLVRVVRLAVGDERLVLLRREPDEHRQRLGVAAHRVGHRVRGRGPARDAAQRREDLGGQRRQHHHRPLEALRPVHGHELHGVRRRRPVELGHLVEPRRHREPREEGADRGVALGVGEARDEVDEGGEPLGPVQEQQLGRRGHLDVETGHRDDAVHEVGQRVADAAAQQPDLRRELAEPAQRLGVVVERAGVVEGVEQRHDVGRVDARDRRIELVGDVGVVEAATTAGEVRRPLAEQREVAQPHPPARAGEQPHQRRVGGGVVQHVEHRDDLGDLRHREHAVDADHLDGQPAVGQRAHERRVVGGGAAQHRDLAGARARVDLLARRGRRPTPSPRRTSRSAPPGCRRGPCRRARPAVPPAGAAHAAVRRGRWRRRGSAGRSGGSRRACGPGRGCRRRARSARGSGRCWPRSRRASRRWPAAGRRPR